MLSELCTTDSKWGTCEIWWSSDGSAIGLLHCFNSRLSLGAISCRKHLSPRIAQPKRNVPITLWSFLNSKIPTSHNDTTEGSRHFFRDGHGNLLTYRFSKNSSGVDSFHWKVIEFGLKLFFFLKATEDSKSLPERFKR